jgi:hypothetical protein
MKRANSNLSHHHSLIALLVAILLIVIGGLGAFARPVSAANVQRPLHQTADQYEGTNGNNVPANAPTLPNLNTINATFVSITTTTSGDDTDWYIVTLAASTSYNIVATATGITALSVELFESLNNANALFPNLVKSGTTTNPASVSYSPGAVAKTVYVKVQNETANRPVASYTLAFNIAQATAIPSSTSSIPTSLLPDVFEPNNLPSQVLNRQGNPVSYLLVGSTFQSSQLPNFVITPTNSPGNVNGAVRDAGDVDWFFFFGRAGSRYRIDATVSPGTDVEMFIYRDDVALTLASNTDRNGIITENDDYQSANRSARVEFTGEYTGRYWIKVWNNDPVPRAGAIALAGYNIGITELAGPGTSTPAPATPFPQNIDQYEYNGDFDSAALIAPNVKYSNLNFVPFRPPTRDTVDNDFFRMPVKQGVYYTCETLDLGAGTDTNLIVFNQNAPQNRDANAIGGNDNISTSELQKGNFASRVIFLAPYTGIIYLLVGDVTPPRAEEAQSRTYSLQCTIGIPNTPTPTIDPRGTATPAPIIVTATEEPPEPTFTPFPTPRPATRLIARPIDGAGAQPTAAPSPTPRVITLDVQVFNDLNRNGLLDAGEGIANASVRLNDEPTNTPLSQAYTDEGRVRFQVTNNTPVKVSIPLFGYSTIVDSSNAVVRVALVPNIDYPVRLP